MYNPDLDYKKTQDTATLGRVVHKMQGNAFENKFNSLLKGNALNVELRYMIEHHHSNISHISIDTLLYSLR